MCIEVTDRRGKEERTLHERSLMILGHEYIIHEHYLSYVLIYNVYNNQYWTTKHYYLLNRYYIPMWAVCTFR